MPVTELKPAQPHAALIRLIRGTGAFIACASIILGCIVLVSIAFTTCRAHPFYFIALLALLLLALAIFGIRRTRIALVVLFASCGCYFFVCAFMAVLHGQPLFSANFGWFGTPLYVLGLLALIWFLGVVFWLFVKRGYDIWRRIDRIAVADFAFVFALFAARVFHYALPAHLPNVINDHLSAHFRDPFNDRGARMLWTYVALYLFFKLIRSYLFQIFDLNRHEPPSNLSTPSGPDGPDKPFIPFDPYDLSKNHPLRP